MGSRECGHWGREDSEWGSESMAEVDTHEEGDAVDSEVTGETGVEER